jgi:hypothetical protein
VVLRLAGICSSSSYWRQLTSRHDLNMKTWQGCGRTMVLQYTINACLPTGAICWRKAASNAVPGVGLQVSARLSLLPRVRMSSSVRLSSAQAPHWRVPVFLYLQMIIWSDSACAAGRQQPAAGPRNWLATGLACRVCHASGHLVTASRTASSSSLSMHNTHLVEAASGVYLRRRFQICSAR